MSKPIFAVEERVISCGYGPRALRQSLDGKAVFLGCKDGSVWAVEAAEPTFWDAPASVHCLEGVAGGTRLAAARAVCEIAPGWLLIGRQDGSLELACWRDPKLERLPVLDAKPGVGRITYINWLGDLGLAISAQGLGTRLLSTPWNRDAEPFDEQRSLKEIKASQAFLRAKMQAFLRDRLDPKAGLAGLQSPVLRAAAALGEVSPPRGRQQTPGTLVTTRLVFVTADGEIRLASHGGLLGYRCDDKPLPWYPDPPALIFDYALVKSSIDPGVPPSPGGFYLPTDAGIFLFDERLLGAGQGPDARVDRRVHLPGIGQLCTTVTHLADRGEEYLWAVEGGLAHMYWRSTRETERSTQEREPPWRKLGLRYEAGETLRVLALSRKLEDDIVIAAARRNDSLVLSRFRRLDTHPWPGLRGGRSSRPATDPAAATDQLMGEARDLLFGGWTEASESLLAFLTQKAHQPEPPDEPELQLAVLFEWLGHQASLRPILEDFLGSPNRRLVDQVFEQMTLRPRDDPGARERCEAAAQLWADTLVGLVHRFFPRRRRELCANVAQWVAHFRDSEKRAPESSFDAVVESVRVWGVFGDPHRLRANPWKAQLVLAEQAAASADDPDADASAGLKHLVYATNLLARMVDSEHESPPAAVTLGPNVRIARHWDEDQRVALVAIYWGHTALDAPGPAKPDRGRILFYRIRVRPPGAAAVVETLAPTELPPSPNSRTHDVAAMAFARDNRGALKLVAALDRGHPERAPGLGDLLSAWRIPPQWLRTDDEDGSKAAAPTSSGRLALNIQDGVASLADARGGGKLIAGLGGTKEKAALLEIALTADGIGRGKVLPIEIGLAESLLHTANPVHALAVVEGQERVLAGCYDGGVWDVDLRSEGRREPVLVEQLGAPVTHLLARRAARGLRIVAGAADGTLMSWQTISAPGPKVPPTYVPLWATSARAPIIGLDLAHPEGPGSRDLRSPIVAAASADGDLFLLDDGERFEQAPSAVALARFARVRGPGSRHLHERLLPSAALAMAFVEPWSPVRAAATAPGKRDDASSASPSVRELAQPLARFLVVTSARTLQCKTIHLLRHSTARREALAALTGEWSTLQTRQPAWGEPYRLREGERMVAACPVFPLYLVRRLFRVQPALELPQGSLPYLFAPLESVIQALRPQPEQKLVIDELREALRRLRESDDAFLYAEVLSELARSLNHKLVELAGPNEMAQGVDDSALDDWHSELDDVLRAVRQDLELAPWAASRAGHAGAHETAWTIPPVQAIRPRVQFLKTLLNGGVIELLGTAASPDTKGVLKVLKTLVDEVGAEVLTGSAVHAIEGMRALTLALTSCALRLSHGNTGRHLAWEAVEPVTRVLGDLTSAVDHSKPGFPDALLHEISRCYALCVCLCPAATLSIAFAISETGTSRAGNLHHRVAGQLALLAQLEVACEDWASTLFVEGGGPLADLINHRWTEETIGPRNWHDLQGASLFVDVAQAIQDLADDLGNPARLAGLSAALAEVVAKGKDIASWRHSVAFWSEAERSWADDVVHHVQGPPGPDRLQAAPEPRFIRPRIAAWARRWSEELTTHEKRRKIFQPQANHYRTVLAALTQAAKDL
jgi:hypothetical protein